VKKIILVGRGKLGADIFSHLKSDNNISSITKESQWESNINVDINKDKIDFICDTLIICLPPLAIKTHFLDLVKKSVELKQITRIILISSIGIYDKKNIINENSSLNCTHPLYAIEQTINQLQVPITILRLGGLFNENRHPGYYVSGKSLHFSKQRINLIHHQDICTFIKVIIKNQTLGVFNLVYPYWPSKEDYYKEFCSFNNLALPLADGKIKVENKVLSDKSLKISNFQFSYHPKFW